MRIDSRVIFSLAHYKPSQLLYKAWTTLRGRLPQLLQPPTPACPPAIRWQPIGHSAPFPPALHVNTADIRKGLFTFLNVSVPLGTKIHWHPKNVGRLWIYNLHYFDYLPALVDRDQLRTWDIIDQWIDANPPGLPNAWDPYPLSLRIVNWIQVLSTVPAPGHLTDKIIRSLYRQVSWLEKSLEKHLLANHYFKNAKALVFAGFFFRGDDADRWLRKGLGILEEQVPEQILQDGAHFERSPMYHAMILKDCLDLLNLKGDGADGRPGPIALRWKHVREEVFSRVSDMFDFLRALSHPDGRIALFNDAALGIEPDVGQLEGYARSIRALNGNFPVSHLRAFPDSGYYVLAPSTNDRLMVDCGPLGPDYQPGHGHCDALSFELSLKGRRVIVDSGTFTYEDGEMRRYNRGNAGHNTVTVDGKDQSEVWGAHRCGRRARPLYARVEGGADGGLAFEGAHDGYRGLPGRPIHHRRIRWRGEEIRIEDRVEGRGIHSLESRLHIHPDLEVERDGEGFVLKESGRRIAVLVPLCPSTITLEKGWYCPEFGLRLECPVVVQRWKGRLPYEGGWMLRKG